MPFQYTVKSGDTKSKLRNQFGVGLNFSGYKYKDINKLDAGEVLSIPQRNIQVKPVVKNNQVDLSKIPEGRKPVQIPEITPPQEVSSPQFQPMTQDEWLQNLANTNPEQAQRITDALNTDNTPIDPATEIQNKAATLQNDIQTLEQRMSERQANKVAGYEETGIFDDMKKLTEMKTNLSNVQQELFAAQDRQIEIPIEERQALRGAQATKATLEQTSRPKIENATLASLAKSREYARLGGAIQNFSGAIQANITAIDAKENANFERNKFIYDTKIKRLNKLETQYGDIMTNRQKATFAEQKFNQDIWLQDRKADGDIRKTVLTKMIESGRVSSGELSRLSNMSTSELLEYKSGSAPENPINWDNLTPEQYIGLDKNTRDNLKFYQDTRVDDKNQTNKRESMKFDMALTIEKIDELLNNESGLKRSVGSLLGDRNIFFTYPGKTADFRASAKSIIAAQTLDTLKNLKATGATMGALSEKELGILINAYNDLGTVFDGDEITGRFNISEDTFKKRAKRIQEAAMRQYLSAELPDDVYLNSNYENMSPEGLRSAYDFVKKNGGPKRQQYDNVKKVDGISRAMEAIGQIESGGNYQALGPVVPSGLYKGEQALGKYQVMPGNLAGWSQEAGLDFTPTPQQFLQSPEIQDRIAASQFLKNYNRYGDWNDVASVWFSGRPVENNFAADVTGTNVPEYIRRFNQYFV